VCVIWCIFVFLCDILLPSGVINDESEILVENRDFLYPPCIRPPPPLTVACRNIAISFGVEKTRMVGLPDGKRTLRISYV